MALHTLTKSITATQELKKYLERMFWPPISLFFFTDFGSLLITLLVCRTNRERSVIICLSETSERSGYSCDFHQQKSRTWTIDININKRMYIVPLPFCFIYPFYMFFVCFYMVFSHLRSTFRFFSDSKLSNMSKIILIKSPT